MRSQAGAELVHDRAAVVGLAALAAVADHFVGLIGVVTVATLCLWFIDMVGGTARAMFRGFLEGVILPHGRRETGIKGAVKALCPHKAIRGGMKLIACALAFAVGGFAEIIQAASNPEGAYIPAVAPLLVIACFFFMASIAEQVNFFWSEFGRKAGGIFDRVRLRGEREAEKRDA